MQPLRRSLDGRLELRLQRQVPCLPRRNRAVFEHHVYRLTVQFEAQPRTIFTAPQRQGRRMSRRKIRLPQCLICKAYVHRLMAQELKNVKRKWARKNEGLERITRAQAAVGNVQENAARF